MANYISQFEGEEIDKGVKGGINYLDSKGYLFNLIGVATSLESAVEALNNSPTLMSHQKIQGVGLVFKDLNSNIIEAIFDDSDSNNFNNLAKWRSNYIFTDIDYPLLDGSLSKFVRADGTLSEITIGSGGYASNVYPTNSNSDVTGYKKLSYTPDVSAVEVSGASSNNNPVLIANYIYDQGVGVTTLDSGIWRFTTLARVDQAQGITKLRITVFKRATNGTETNLFSFDSEDINNTVNEKKIIEYNAPLYTIATTDRIGIRLYAISDATSNRTITLTIGDGNAAYLNTPIALRHKQLREPNEDANVQHMTSTQKTAVDGLVNGNYQLKSEKNAANGYAGLDASGKLTEALLPYQYQKTSEKGQPNGYASLDGSGDVPDAQIPANIERNTNKNVANGYAGLDSDGYVPISLIRSDLLERLYSYGVKYDVTISSPTLTRTMNMDLHRSLPIQSKMRGCLLDDNGVIVEYIEDWSTAVKDGSKGQVMIEIPTHYIRFITDGNTREVRMSEIPIPGYKLINKYYISAYEASVNRTNSKLSSVINMSVDYRGGNNNATWDGTYRTLLGRPATLLSRTNLRTYARNRNGAATSEWNLMVYSSYRDLFWLFALEYATLNSQLPFNPVKDANGFSQGGLGNGVTTLASTQWNNYNSYYPFVPCGHSDSIGTGSGEVAYNMIDDLGSTVAIVMVNRYRGVELPFGHIWKWTDGINIDVKSDADGGTSKIYTCENTDKYNDDGYDYYDMIGLEGRSEGYVRKITFGESGDISAAEVGGGSTTYFCDYHYASVSSSSLRGVLFGGNASNGANAGFVYSYSNDAPSRAKADVGSRLCFIPQRTR